MKSLNERQYICGDISRGLSHGDDSNRNMGKIMSISQEAKTLVDGERRNDYGDVNESFNRIAGLWTAYLGFPIDSLDVGKMMILLKVSRARHSNKRDCYLDIAGYVECIDQLLPSIS